MNIELKSTFTPNTVGAFLDVPMDVYQAAPGWSGSDLLLLKQWPAKAHARKTQGTQDKPSEAMIYGTLLNDMILLGRRDGYYIRPDFYESTDKPTKANPHPETVAKPWNSNSNTCKAWLAAHSDKPVLSEYEADVMMGEVIAVQKDRRAQSLLTGGHAEVSLFAYIEDEDGKPTFCKGRVDYLLMRDGKLLVPDLKTIRDASTWALSKAIHQRKYHVKAYLYRALLLALDPTLTEAQIEFYFVALEKGTPPRVNVRRLVDSAVDAGGYDLMDALKLRLRCSLVNRWPDFSDDTEDAHQIGTVDLPNYAQRGESVDDLDGLTEAAA